MNNAKITIGRILLFGLLITATFSCNRNPLDVNVKNINVSIKIDRVDKSLSAIDTVMLKAKYPLIEQSNVHFFDHYTGDVLKIGTPETEDFYFYLKSFLSDTVITKVNKKIDEVYHDDKKLNDELSDAFKHYAYYFPNKPIPKIYAVNGGFNVPIFTSDKNVGICLDMYLGNNCIYYDYLGVEQYKKFNMTPSNIISDLMKSIAEQEISLIYETPNLLSSMIYSGKLLYYVDAMCPRTADSLKIGYSKIQMKWCADNELGMWNYFVDKQLLYSSDRLVLKQFMNNAPFTNAFSDSSPGRTGEWIGWQIVKAYMKKHKEITLDSLMKNTDYQSILNNSSYHP